MVKVVRNSFNYGVDRVTGRIDLTKLPQNNGDENRTSYCDTLAHCTLKEEHEYVLQSLDMVVIPKRRIAIAKLTSPLILTGDVKVEVHALNLTSDTCYFVWFNTNFITDQFTTFTGAEVDCSKSSQSSSSSSSSSSSLTSSSSMDAASDLYSSSVVVDMDEHSRSLSRDSSTRSLIPPADPDIDTSSLLRLYFDGRELRENTEARRLQEIPVEEGDILQQSSLKPMALFQKASSQIIHSTRTLISRVSSAASTSTPMLHRVHSESSTSQRSRSSSRELELGSPRALSPIDLEVERIPSSRSVNSTGSSPEVLFRDRHDIERRERMRMSKLNESEEFMQSLNSNVSDNGGKNKEEQLDAIDEGDDEIHLESDPEEHK